MSTLAPVSAQIFWMVLPPEPMTSRIFSTGIFMEIIFGAYSETSARGSETVSYTHLDVYKRQEWASPYEPEACKEGTFHASDGREQTATYLYSEERSYLEVAGATGFVKHYSGGRYSFAGLLPAEGSTPEALLEALDGETLLQAIDVYKRQGQKVVKVFNHEQAAIERFNELNEQLRDSSCRANSYANVLMPVSYTHLDVYKRQPDLPPVRCVGGQCSRRRARCA